MCDADAGTRTCPMYRCLKNQGKSHRDESHVTNVCCNSGCRKPLCGHHLYPNDRGSDDTRLKFCEQCIRQSAHCTQCGFSGIDEAYNTNQETNGKHHHARRELSPWFCGGGCHNLVCSRCGTANDGCQIHARTWPAIVWYSHWQPRRYQGRLFKQAPMLHLTPTQAATWQNYQQLLATAPVPLAIHDTQFEYAPQVVPAPATLADDTTLFPGETTGLVTDPTALVGNIPADDSGLSPDTASQCSTAATMTQQFFHPVMGYILTKYLCNERGEVWLHDPVEDELYCWALEHPDYHHPTIGISQSEADALLAIEVCRRAEADADLLRQAAQEAEMVSTAKAQQAAEATAIDRADKEAALAAAAAKDTEAANWAQVLRDQANSDATHRRNRAAIAAIAATTAPEAIAVAIPDAAPPHEANLVQPDTAQALAPPLAATSSAIQPQCQQPSYINRFSEAMSCMTFTLGPTPARRRRKDTNTQASA